MISGGGIAASSKPYGLAIGRAGCTVPVGLRACAAFEAVSDGVQTQAMSSLFIPLSDPNATTVYPYFGNWLGGTSGAVTPFFYDGDGAATITFSCAVESGDAVPQLIPFRFQGSHSGVLTPATPSWNALMGPDDAVEFGNQVLDATTGQLGVVFRIFLTVPAGTYPLNYANVCARDTFRSGTGALLDLTTPGSGAVAAGTGQSTAWGPVMVMGRPHSRKPIYTIIGDSIPRGQTDTRIYWGMHQRACAQLGFHALRVEKGGETAGQISSGPASMRYRGLFLEGGTDAGVQNATNDGILSNGAGVLTLQGRWTTIANRLLGMGYRFVHAFTVTPRTTSTDSWATFANQTATAGAQPGPLQTFNNWALSQPAPFNAPTCDWYATCGGTGANYGFWDPSLGITPDGVHMPATQQADAGTGTIALRNTIANYPAP